MITIISVRKSSPSWFIGCLGLLIPIALSFPVHAQSNQSADAAKADAAKNKVKQAQSSSFPLTTTATNENVQQNVSVEAVLIPPRITKKIFGNEIGNNYAAIALTISNRSTDASLIVNSIFIDYSRWLLSGYNKSMAADDPCTQSASPKDQKDNAGEPAGSGTKDNSETPATHQHNALQPWQSQTCPSQIASTEYRMVRGELLEAQPWTLRNWVIRSLVAVGSIASAYTFTTSRMATVQGIGAFNGQVIPAAEAFWPDPVVGQLNNISDLAFRVNKVIERQASDIIVAFYPMDRFITPGLKRLFISSPAIFFSPDSTLLDPDARRQMERFIKPLLPPDTSIDSLALSEPLIAAGGCLKGAASPAPPIACNMHAVLKGVSLNNVRVVVGGSMTVDVDSVPAVINSVELDTPSTGTLGAALAKAGDVTGVIEGSFLTGGQPSIVEADQDGIKNVVAVQDGSTDSELHFKMTLSKPLTAEDKKLTFTVTKTDKQKRTIVSATREYDLPAIPAATTAAPAAPAGGAAAPAAGAANPTTGTPAPAASPNAPSQPMQKGAQSNTANP
jgi:hypothetical protein